MPQGPVHQFTVQRGMSVVLVIETTAWYSGLLQAALARIVLEGRQNLRPGAAVVERSHEGNSAVAASGAQSKASAP